MVDGVVAWTDHDRDVLSAYGKKLSALELASALGGRHTIAAVKDELLRLSLRAQP